MNLDELLVSQPDTGEQALEITDTLVRSGAVDAIVGRLGGRAGALRRVAGRHGRFASWAAGAADEPGAPQAQRLDLRTRSIVVIFINQIREKIGVMFGNPETTPGGRALKFYASLRMDIRRIGSIKDRDELVGNKTRVKVVKNKVAPPFKQAEFDIMFNVGIDHYGILVDLGVDADIVQKSGAWFSYGEVRLGQGRENAKAFLQENPEITAEIERKVREHLGMTGPAAPEEPAEVEAAS
jgi:recombination protein RecA